MAWSPYHYTDFGTYTSIVAVGGNQVLVDNWADVVGNLFSIDASHHLVAGAGSGGASSLLRRPAAENARDQRIFLNFTALASFGTGTISIKLRWVDSSNWFACELNNTSLTFYSNVGGAINVVGVAQNFSALTVGHNYTMEFSAVGAAPTTLATTLIDVTGATTIVNNYNTTSAAVGLQVAASSGLASAGGFTQTVKATMYTQATAIAVNNAGLYFSPFTFEFNGGGSPAANNVGAAATIIRSVDQFYFVVPFSGTGVTMQYNQAAYSVAGDYPLLDVSVDNGPWGAQLALTPGDGGFVGLCSGLADTAHVLRVYLGAWTVANGRWGMPAIGSGYAGAPYACLEIDGFLVSGTGTMGTYTPRPNTLLALTDSIGEGLHARINNFAQQDARVSFVHWLADALNAEYGLAGFSGIGVVAVSGGGGAGIWSSYSNAMSRLFGGSLVPSPTYIFTNLGANDFFGAVSNATITAAFNTMINAMRAASASAQILIGIEPGRYALAAINAITLIPDSYIIDPGAYEATGLTTNPAGDGGTLSGPSSKSWDTSGGGDGLHPSIDGHAGYVAAMMRAIVIATLVIAQKPRVVAMTGGMSG